MIFWKHTFEISLALPWDIRQLILNSKLFVIFRQSIRSTFRSVIVSSWTGIVVTVILINWLTKQSIQWLIYRFLRFPTSILSQAFDWQLKEKNDFLVFNSMKIVYYQIVFVVFRWFLLVVALADRVDWSANENQRDQSPSTPSFRTFLLTLYWPVDLLVMVFDVSRTCRRVGRCFII